MEQASQRSYGIQQSKAVSISENMAEKVREARLRCMEK
jgi:hypothetical protein